MPAKKTDDLRHKFFIFCDLDLWDYICTYANLTSTAEKRRVTMNSVIMDLVREAIVARANGNAVEKATQDMTRELIDLIGANNMDKLNH